MVSTTEIVINKWALSAVVLWLAAMILSVPERSWWAATLGIFFMYWWVYWTHRALHMLPSDGWLGFWNTHMRFHHQPADAKPLPRWLELAFEIGTDLGMNLSLLGIQWLTGIYVVPISCIVLFAIAYMSVHIFNYSIVGSEVHKAHHLTLTKNFGPDTMDHIYGTNLNSEAEDLDPLALNAIFAYFIVRGLKTFFAWTS